MKKQAITLGRVGILLPIAVIIPIIGTLAGLAGMILLLISHYNFSKAFEKPPIFNRALLGTIVTVGGNLIGFIILGISIGLAVFSLEGAAEPAGYQEAMSLIFGSGFAIFGLIIVLAGLIIGAYFYFQSLKDLAEKTGVNLFRTAGLLYFIGAITSIILIGLLVAFVGWIIHIIAYFSIKSEEEEAVAV